MGMTVNSIATNALSSYSPSSQPAPAKATTSSPTSGSSTTSSNGTDGTISSYEQLKASLAEENLSYLNAFRGALESGLLANGIIDSGTDEALFGSGTLNLAGLTGSGSSSSSSDSSLDVIATRGLSSLAYDVLTGKKTLDSVMHHPASSTPTTSSDSSSDDSSTDAAS